MRISLILKTFLLPDVAYTDVPNRVKLRKDKPHDADTTFWGLAELTFPDEYDEIIKHRPHSWPGKNHDDPPDKQLTCFDLLYFVGADSVSFTQA